MIGKIPVKPEWLTQAKLDAQNMGKLRASITNGEGNLAGFVGEIVVQNLLGAIRSNTYDYDLLLGDKLIDVKTKRCTSKPLPNYECSVAAFNTKQKCTHYIFTRVLEPDYSTCWVLGYLEKEEYFNVSRFCEAGTVDEKDHRGWTFKADCYNIEIGQLKDVRELWNLVTV